MEARNQNISRLGSAFKYEQTAVDMTFEQSFENLFTESEIQAYQLGQLDKVQGKPCNPQEHGFRELSKERNHYEAGYANEESLINE